MAHSSVLAWRIPGTAESGGLPSMGSHRVGHDWSDLAGAAAAYDDTRKFCEFSLEFQVLSVKGGFEVQEGVDNPSIYRPYYQWMQASLVKNLPEMQEMQQKTEV